MWAVPGVDGHAYLGDVYSDADIAKLLTDLGSGDSSVRALAADTAGDGISGWGQHGYADGQAARIAHALVDALAVETDDVAREAVLHTLAEFVAWDLAPAAAVSRALDLPRSPQNGLQEYWRELEDWAGWRRAT